MNSGERLLPVLRQARFPHQDGLIHLFVGGSELHGAKVKHTDDLDVYGVYLETPEFALGLEKHDFFVWSTASNERRNGPEDIDLTMYSLRKWAALAAKGNPTALHFLFAPNCAPEREVWQPIAERREVFLSRQASLQFRGFAGAQFRRLHGIAKGKKDVGHELMGAHAYDLKAAMHTVRLLNEGIELMRFGTITLPRPEKELLISIRTGEYGSLDRVLNLANTLFSELDQAAAQSCLPESVNRGRVSELISAAYLTHWRLGSAAFV